MYCDNIVAENAKAGYIWVTYTTHHSIREIILVAEAYNKLCLYTFSKGPVYSTNIANCNENAVKAVIDYIYQKTESSTNLLIVI